MLCHASPHLAPCVRDETLDEVLQAAERLDPLVSFLPTACSRRTDPHPITHRIDREFGRLLMEDFGRSWTSPNLPRCVTGRSLTPSLTFGSYNFYKGFTSLASCCYRHAGRFLQLVIFVDIIAINNSSSGCRQLPIKTTHLRQMFAFKLLALLAGCPRSISILVRSALRVEDDVTGTRTLTCLHVTDLNLISELGKLCQTGDWSARP